MPDPELDALLAADDDYSQWGQGSRADGAPCSEAYQCESNLCSSDGGRACGVCLMHLRVGALCGKSTEACSRSAACIGGICQTTRTWIGGSCRYDPKGGSGDCDDELVCVPVSATASECRRPLALGAACREDRSTGACRLDTFCGPNGVCDRFPPPGPSTVEFCAADGTCSTGKACDTNGRCAAVVVAAQGACPTGGPLCARGTVCTGEPKVCVVLPTEGQPAIIGRCADGLYADSSVNHLCQPKRGLHSACTTDWCAAGLECRRGECEVPCG